MREAGSSHGSDFECMHVKFQSVVMRYVESTAPLVAMDSVRRRLAPGLALSALTPASDHETHYPSSFLSSDRLDFLSICMNTDMDTSSLHYMHKWAGCPYVPAARWLHLLCPDSLDIKG
jgi:hypothetical protein